MIETRHETRTEYRVCGELIATVTERGIEAPRGMYAAQGMVAAARYAAVILHWLRHEGALEGALDYSHTRATEDALLMVSGSPPEPDPEILAIQAAAHEYRTTTTGREA